MKCVICGEQTKNRSHICDKCIRNITQRPQNECTFCHVKLGPGVELCNFCQYKKYHFQKLYNLGYYKMAMGDLIRKIKFKENIKLARYLGVLLGEYLHKLNITFDYIIPVPISTKRFHERGFDQALEISKGIRRVLKTKILYNFVRKKNIPPLEHMKRIERYKTMKDAFFIKKDGDILDNKIILIVDDVFTTGATTENMSKLLSQYNPLKIIVGVLAR